jgi:predicted oxidoreductase (fatty acid repression mutant protein)
MSIESIAKEVVEELERAEKKFAGFNSSHEGYAVLLEEVDELWDVVKLNPKKIVVEEQEFNYNSDIPKIQIKKHKKMMRAEAIQVAAMAMRFVKCVCDEDIEDKS